MTDEPMFYGPTMSSEQVKRIFKTYYEVMHKRDYRKNRDVTHHDEPTTPEEDK